MTQGAIWIVAGLVLAGLEMLAPGVFLLWIGLAAVGTGVVTELSAFGWQAQLVLFIALTAVLVGLIAVRQKRRPTLDPVNAPAAGLIGQTCRAIDFLGHEGRVSLGDGTWPARLTDATQPVAGQALRVVGLDGTTLLVSGTN